MCDFWLWVVGIDHAQCWCSLQSQAWWWDSNQEARHHEVRMFYQVCWRACVSLWCSTLEILFERQIRSYVWTLWIELHSLGCIWGRSSTPSAHSSQCPRVWDLLFMASIDFSLGHKHTQTFALDHLSWCIGGSQQAISNSPCGSLCFHFRLCSVRAP